MSKGHFLSPLWYIWWPPNDSLEGRKRRRRTAIAIAAGLFAVIVAVTAWALIADHLVLGENEVFVGHLITEIARGRIDELGEVFWKPSVLRFVEENRTLFSQKHELLWNVVDSGEYSVGVQFEGGTGICILMSRADRNFLIYSMYELKQEDLPRRGAG